MPVRDSKLDSVSEEMTEEQKAKARPAAAGDPPEAKETLGTTEDAVEVTAEDIAAVAEAGLRKALEQIEAIRGSAQRARSRAEAELQVQRRRALNAETRLDQSEAMRQEAEEAFEEQRIASAELTTVLRAAEYRLADLEKAVETSDEEFASLRKTHAGEAEHARSLRAQIETLAEASREAAAERDRIAEELAAAENARSTAAKELENLKRRLTKRQEDIERLNAELKEVRAQTISRVGDSGAATGTVPAAAEVTARLAELEAALDATRQREESHKGAARQATSRVEELEDLLEQTRARQLDLEQGLERRQAELGEHTAVRELLTHERNELLTEVNALRAEREQVGRDLANAEHIREQRGEQRSLMEARLGELERGLQSSQEHETILQATVGELQEVLQQEQAGSALLRADGQTQGRLRQTLEGELLEARAHANELEARLLAQTQQQILELAKISEKARTLEVDRDSLHEQMVNLASARDHLEREVEQLGRRVEMEKQKGEMARLQAKLEEVESRHPDALAGGGGAKPLQAPPTRQRSSSSVSKAPAVDEVPAHMPIIAIGASTGGPAVLNDVLPQFPEDLSACFLIIQHMPPGYTAELASSLAHQAKITVVEARHGDLLRPGIVFIAPGGHHMEMHNGRIRLTSSPPVNKHRPSVDVMFSSLIPVAKRVCAVLLSGMGNDGVVGMTRLRAAGAETLVQDEASSVVWGMPGAAVSAGCVSKQVTPKQLVKFLLERTEAVCEKDGDSGLIEENAALSRVQAAQ